MLTPRYIISHDLKDLRIDRIIELLVLGLVHVEVFVAFSTIS